MNFTTESASKLANILRDDSAGNKQATMTDIDLAASAIESLSAQRDHFQQLAEHRGRSIDNLMNINGKQNTEIERLTAQRDQLLAALEIARETLGNVRGDINQERGYADELEADVDLAFGTASAAIAAAKGGAV